MSVDTGSSDWSPGFSRLERAPAKAGTPTGACMREWRMYNPALAVDGAVAVHRWFADGSAWAYHPWFRGKTRDLLEALDRQLKSEARDPFEVSGLGGVLIGEKAEDPDCGDRRALHRRPAVL